MSMFTPTSRYVNCVCTPSEAVVIAAPAEYDPVATGILEPIFSVAFCPSVGYTHASLPTACYAT